MPIRTYPSLFTAPRPLNSASAVIREASKESTVALVHVLRDNHEKTHIFFNDRGFHNHITHHVIALWAFAAPPVRIHKTYSKELDYQRKPIESPGVITKQNFGDHLADERYYNAYMTFFADQINKKGAAAVVEEFVFSKPFNFPDGGGAPQMLDRLVSGIFHPLIHTGYGLEFDIHGMVVEGLAQTAAHSPSYTPVLPKSIFVDGPSDSSDRHLNSISILLQAQEEIRLPTDKVGQTRYVLDHYAEELNRYINQWLAGVDCANEQQVSKMMEELEFMNVVVYGVSGLTNDAEGKMTFRADFVRMHSVTSSLFIRPFITSLSSPQSKSLFLRAYFAASLTNWVSHGPARIDIAAFYKHTPVPNPTRWNKLADEAIAHADDHLIKLFRALAHYDQSYKTRKNGDIEGSEQLDGTLFLRTAELTSTRVKKNKGEIWDFMLYN